MSQTGVATIRKRKLPWCINAYHL
ncbi:hypothetical protein [Psychromonas sp. MB-3u-54]